MNLIKLGLKGCQAKQSGQGQGRAQAMVGWKIKKYIEHVQAIV